MPRKAKSQRKQRSMTKDVSPVVPGNTIGDIPKGKFDQVTVSVRRPRLTATFTTRTIQEFTPIVTSTSSQAGTFTIIHSNCDNSSNYASLFDQYRIDYCRFEFKPVSNAIQAVVASAITFPALHMVIDYDNASNLSGVGAARAYDNCMILEAHESASRAFVPRIAVAAYAGAFTSFANMQPEWIDSGNTGVIHYGIKWYLPAASAAQTILPTWNVYAEVVLSLRSVI